jgi:two-component system, chemotaxis family, CheB/CheR fusion protein
VRAIALQAGAAQPGSDAARDRFLDEASHELRTPITALKGQLQLMQRRLRKDPSRHDDSAELDRMLYQVQRLNHQLDVLLAATHIQQHRYALLLAPCDIVAIVRQLVAVYAAGISSHSLDFETTLDTLVGEWDRKRIEEAVAALLSNAIKYSPGGKIVILLRCQGEKAHLEVQDEGNGVMASERSAIFRAYTTGSATESAGLGLGLYIAREAIRLQHGRIGVRSSRKRGSCFWFDLPLHQPESGRGRSTRSRRSSQSSEHGTAPGSLSALEATATHTRTYLPAISAVMGI